MIDYYKRQNEWKVSYCNTEKIYDDVRAGSFEEYTLQGMKIEPLTDDSLFSALSTYHECQIQCKKIRSIAENMASRVWSFEITCYFEWRRTRFTVYFYTHYSVSILFMGNPVDFINVHTADDLLEKMVILQTRFRQFERATACKVHSSLMSFPVVFHNSAAAAFAHEVLGHLFEADNFYRFGYDSIADMIRVLRLRVIDDPLIPESPGFYMEDDMGIGAQRTIIADNGLIYSLIGCKKKGESISNALRRENYNKPCFPRMSNLIVESPKALEKRKTGSYIQIEKLGKCFLYHDKRIVEFNVEFSFFHNEKLDIPMKPFKLNYDVDPLLSNICVVDGGDMELRPIQCAKHNQVICCGASSPDWMINV